MGKVTNIVAAVVLVGSLFGCATTRSVQILPDGTERVIVKEDLTTAGKVAVGVGIVAVLAAIAAGLAASQRDSYVVHRPVYVYPGYCCYGHYRHDHR